MQTAISFDIKKSRQRRDEGMMRAETKANKDHEGWSEKALEFLKGYAGRNPKFMGEDVRFAAQGVVPTPKSQRAWGSIFIKAVKLGWIHNKNCEYQKVKNVNAHSANASVWKSNIVKY